MTLIEHISQAPDALRGPIYWLIFINTASVFFVFGRMEARAVLAVWLANVGLTLALFEFFGFTQALGLAYLALWTPLLFWLIHRNAAEGLREPRDIWLATMFASNLAALFVGYLILFRHVSGEHTFA
ncbi:hypothetical protein [Parvibaculum sp.]|jgi:uncharacterized membrane-anchored protein YitT (DUF2179 family)|uniref:hypothetical protein n=1 Tax=Parvibaculum sp. TaxID=2024848 RepID=UPI001B1DF1B2|nr:hypothetical protein [Parvibaculum sp.]MBO6635620.1 hypothetical protein [Parvibaculum sp.]MBO6679820.1 hypothetical protein [Parvibaculum sp.]MBO6683819.1 hypothetical protein [Parvibaculum sp.]MBO6905752.1 hypothetical protein [Parvibaculum sp.]